MLITPIMPITLKRPTVKRRVARPAPALVLWLAVLFAPAIALAAPPQATFTTSVFGDDAVGQDCVAPCFVFVDAQGTTDAESTREFHQLNYRWDFGDPGSGFLRTGGSANVTRGPLAGHMYEVPGSYTITLETTDPSGESSSTTRSITVQDPVNYFAGNTYCVSRGNSFGSWCPAGATQVSNSGNLNSVLQGTPNVDGSQVWVVLACGETWQSSGPIQLNRGSRPGMISSRGNDGNICSNLPVMHYTTGGFSVADSWTVSGIALDGPDTVGGYDGGFTLGEGDDGFVVHRVAVRGASGSTIKIVASGNGATRLAVWGSTLEMSPNGDETGSNMFWMGSHFAIMNTLIDNHLKAEFNLRFSGARQIVLSDSEWRQPGFNSLRNAIQLRGNDLQATPSGRAVIRRNLFVSHGNTFAPFLRFCRDAGCNNEGPNSPVATENIIVENNHMRFDRPVARAGGFGFVTVQAGEVTVRNNTVDLRGMGSIGGGINFCNVVNEPRGGGSYDNVHCFNNTLYSNEPSNTDITLCTAVVGSGHRCYNNLVYTPNRSGDYTAGNGNWSEGGNVDATSNPFAFGSSPGPIFQSTGAEFDLASNDTMAADRGVSIAGTFANAAPFDWQDNCRVGALDVGAFERGSAQMGCAGGGVSIPAPFPSPVLLAQSSPPQSQPPSAPDPEPEPEPEPQPQPPPQPQPQPTPTTGACAVQPILDLDTVVGGPFTDCGFVDSYRMPPAMKHFLEDVDSNSTCILPSFTPATWAFPNLPDIEIMTSNMIYHNSGTFPGDVIFTGQNVIFMNTQNGQVVGDGVCGPGARNIEFNGNCICP